MVKYEEIDLKGDGEWSRDGFTVRVVKWDLKNYRQKLEARFEDKTKTWYFGLHENRSIELFDGVLIINDKGTNFKNKIQRVSIEAK